MNQTEILAGVNRLFQKTDPQSRFLARQLLFSSLPATHFIESYLQDNEGAPQSLDLFPMMKPIYNNMPQRLLLKCSRKTLKSTLLSNIICLNMIRWNDYKMLYVAPQEAIAKYFSSNYVAPRFESPLLKKIFVEGWNKNDVYEKIFQDTNSAVLFKYANVDATRCRGPATDQNFYDEVQDILFDILPIIGETMALSKFQREMYAGTPLTTDNTINELWKSSTQYEWAMKCSGCNHWNMLIESNNPVAMIRPDGLGCAKCSKILDSSTGEWVSGQELDLQPATLVGYHLAQPIIPHYNTNAKSWAKVHNKVHNPGEGYKTYQIYNEVFGLAYDVGSKPITKEQLQALCVLGPQRNPDSSELPIYVRNRSTYVKVTTGVDWGVNAMTSRTAVVHGGLRRDGVYEVFSGEIFDDVDYAGHIANIAATSNKLQSLIVADSGPDPHRAHELGVQTAANRMLIARYGNGKLVQTFDMPKGATNWRENRYILHRSDCFSFVFRLLKEGKILFPAWEQMERQMHDILNEFIEAKDGNLGVELIYSHPPQKPDDFLHALLYAVVCAYSAVGDRNLIGPSSTAHYASFANTNSD